MLVLRDVTVVDKVRVVERVLRGAVDCRGDTAVFDEDVEPFLGCLLAHAHEHALAEFFAVGFCPGERRAGVALVGVDVGEVDGGDVVVEEVLEEVAHLQPAAVPGL